MDEVIPDDARDISERLSMLADEQDLIGQAKDGCARWFHNHAEDIRYKLSDVRMDFQSQALVFKSALLSYPYIDTRLTLTVNGREIGHYRLITLLDGTVNDDYFILDTEV